MAIINKKEILEYLQTYSPLIGEYINTEDVFKYFYRLPNDFQTIQYVSLYNYCIVMGDFVLGIRHTSNNNENYYMFISANSFGALPQEISVGKSIDGTIYLTGQCFPRATKINFVAFPEEAINTKINGFVPKSYRDKMDVFDDCTEDFSDTTLKCLDCGLEASKIFQKLIDDYKQRKDSDKRKKLNI